MSSDPPQRTYIRDTMTRLPLIDMHHVKFLPSELQLLEYLKIPMCVYSCQIYVWLFRCIYILYLLQLVHEAIHGMARISQTYFQTLKNKHS